MIRWRLDPRKNDTVYCNVKKFGVFEVRFNRFTDGSTACYLTFQTAVRVLGHASKPMHMGIYNDIGECNSAALAILREYGIA